MPEITRIDFYKLPDGNVRVAKYPEGWGLKTPSTANYISDRPLDEMLAWLQENGWIIRTWGEGPWLSGARAWKDELIPVHTAYEIKRRRENLQRENAALTFNGTNNGLNLAYDT